MRFSRLFLVLIISAVLGLPVLAQTSSKVVKIYPAGRPKLKPGASAPVTVQLEIAPGYHINSNRPNQDFLVATALKFDRTPGLATGPVTYPKPKMQTFKFSPNRPLSVYDGKVSLRFTVRALASLGSGEKILKGKLTIQACNDEVCLRPETVPVDIPIDIL